MKRRHFGLWSVSLLVAAGLMLLAPAALAAVPNYVAIAANGPAAVPNFANLATTNGVHQVVFVDSAKFSTYTVVRMTITTSAYFPAATVNSAINIVPYYGATTMAANISSAYSTNTTGNVSIEVGSLIVVPSNTIALNSVRHRFAILIDGANSIGTIKG